MPIYFVTGGAGFVGRHVCTQLTQLGFEVRAVVRSIDNGLTSLGVKLWIGDLWEVGTLSEAISGANVIIHCAGNARFGNGAHYHRENVALTENIIKAAKQNAHKDCRFVFVSTIGAIDRAKVDCCVKPLTEACVAYPTSDYGRSKLMAEEIIKKSGIPFTIIRPAMVVGNEMRSDSHFSVFARQSLSNSLLARVAWPGRFSVIHVADLAGAILTVSTNIQAEGNTYFCAGEAISVADCYRQSNPGKQLVSLSLITSVLRPFVRWLPFALKAMLYPALTASDENLQALGWYPKHTAQSALAEVIAREKARSNPELSPGGQTVITGAVSGLGREFVKYLHKRREHLLLIDKDGAALKKLASKLNNCSISVVDLSNVAEVDLLLASHEWNAYNVTELFACAGIGLRGSMQDVSIENHRKMFAVNVLARIALAQEAIASMRKHHFGRIVLISSSSAFQPLPYMATYAATNSALLSLGEAWGAEIANNDVHIMTVCPGGMQTGFQKSGGVREVEGEKLMLPEIVVEAIINGLRKQKTTLIVSARSYAMSMLARCLPRRISVTLWCRLMQKMR